MLQDAVINKIAAGEVVDRPISVVRELVDNAVDAGADKVLIQIQKGGKSLIRVIDNGKGMTRDDVMLAFERHTTSKIRNAEDLTQLHSYGFRGEALASIAAVSAVVLRSKDETSPSATEIEIRAGKIKSVNSVAGPTGTDIAVRNLFFNVPARRKFLRQEATENRRIRHWVQRFALANPSIAFSLEIDSKESLRFPAGQDFLSRARRMIKGAACEVSTAQNDISVSGLVAHPALAQLDSKSLTTIVNGRVVTDSLLLKAVKDGFDATLKDREYPCGCLHITVATESVDVNVHPQKSEVRFLQPQSVFNVVKEAVLAASANFSQPVSSQFEKIPMSSSPTSATVRTLNRSPQSSLPYQRITPLPINEAVYGSTARAIDVNSNTAPLYSATSSTDEVDEAISSEEDQTAIAPFRFSDLRYIGQTLQCYLLCECSTTNRFVVVDMHAAHERVRFNQLRKAYYASPIASQTLLVPLVVDLSEDGTAAIENEEHMLQQFGFSISALSETQVAVRAIPSILSGSDIAELVKRLASDLLAFDQTNALQHAIDAVSLRIACHGSIRSGYKIKSEEVYELFAQMDATDFSAACPHGRPVVVAFNDTAVERWFGRDR